MRRILIAAAVLALPVAAMAQQSIDPRIAAPMVAAQQAEIALRDAAIKAMQQDAAKREAEWAEYAKPLWLPQEGK